MRMKAHDLIISSSICSEIFFSSLLTVAIGHTEDLRSDFPQKTSERNHSVKTSLPSFLFFCLFFAFVCQYDEGQIWLPSSCVCVVHPPAKVIVRKRSWWAGGDFYITKPWFNTNVYIVQLQLRRCGLEWTTIFIPIWTSTQLVLSCVL